MNIKNSYKSMKLFVFAVAVGETIASYYKNEEFKKLFDNAKWFDKCKVVFNNLVEINGNFLKKMKNIDYNTHVDKYKNMLEDELEVVKSKLDDVKEQAGLLKDNTFKPVIDELNKKYEEIRESVLEKHSYIKDNAIEKIDEILDKYQDKIEWIDKKIVSIKKQIREKLDK